MIQEASKPFEYPDGRMGTKAASQYTGLSVKTLATLRCTGKGPKYIKMGRIFYYKGDLDSWIATHQKVQSTQEERVKQNLLKGDLS